MKSLTSPSTFFSLAHRLATHRLAAGVMIACLCCGHGWSEDPSAIMTKEFIFTDADFDQCHASTIEQTTKGGMVAAWFGGTREGRKDVGIWVSRHVERAWSEPVEVANGIQYIQSDGQPHRHPCWNPVLHQPPQGPLQLYYKCGPNPREWWGMLTESADGGKTWSTSRRLPEHIDGPVKNKPVRLSDGSLLAGSSTEYDGWRVHMERTTDNGVTWHRTGPLNDGEEISAIQPSILKHGGETLQALGRSRQGKIWQMWSQDNGKTWSEMTLTDLPNPNSGTDAVTLSDGRHVLVYNHTPRGRSPLNVAISKDGHDWTSAVILEDEPGEYSYPAVIQSADGKIHITYTWRRLRIRHVVLDPAKLP